MDGWAGCGQDAGQERLTIQEAARRLGVSEGAIRKRVARDTLAHDKAPDGKIYVYLDTGDRRGVDTGQDEGVHPESSALISQLRDEISYLRDENRRKDEIIMQQALSMRQLTGPSEEPSEEPSESPEPRYEGAATPTEPTEGSQEVEQERISWRAPTVVGIFILLVASILYFVLRVRGVSGLVDATVVAGIIGAIGTLAGAWFAVYLTRRARRGL